MPSHVQNVPVSLIVFVGMTLSIADTDSETERIPSISQPGETLLAMSLSRVSMLAQEPLLFKTDVATSPGWMASMVVWLSFLWSSAAMCYGLSVMCSTVLRLRGCGQSHTRNAWFSAAFDAAYAANLNSPSAWEDLATSFHNFQIKYPSSKALNSAALPESLDINRTVWMRIEVWRSRWATIIGPMVFVRRWSSKSWNELIKSH